METGIYKYIRHPIYAMLLAETLGFCVALSNWVSFLLIFVPNLLTVSYRIYVEERALLEVFGDRYRSYMKSTKRLIPKII